MQKNLKALIGSAGLAALMATAPACAGKQNTAERNMQQAGCGSCGATSQPMKEGGCGGCGGCGTEYKNEEGGCGGCGGCGG